MKSIHGIGTQEYVWVGDTSRMVLVVLSRFFYKDGGGVREVPLPSLDIDIRGVIHHSKEVIFPTGECKYGDVNQMELSLGDYARKILKNFDIQGDDTIALENICKHMGSIFQDVHFT